MIIIYLLKKVNSATKYICGHSDVVFGTLTCNDKKLYDRLYFSAKSTGFYYIL